MAVRLVELRVVAAAERDCQGISYLQRRWTEPARWTSRDWEAGARFTVVLAMRPVLGARVPHSDAIRYVQMGDSESILILDARKINDLRWSLGSAKVSHTLLMTI